MIRLCSGLSNRRGAAMLVALCLGAVLLALSASLLAAAAQSGVSGERSLEREQAYQLALSFSRRLDADLCGEQPGNIASFLHDTFLGDAYADDTPYTFTAANTEPSDPYGQISVTLQRRRLPLLEQTWAAEEDLSVKALIQQMDAFEASAADSADYLVAVTVTARTETAEFSYTQQYIRCVEYPVVYTVEGQTCRRRPGTLQFDCDAGTAGTLDLTDAAPSDRGAITARCDPDQAANGRFENLAQRGL